MNSVRSTPDSAAAPSSLQTEPAHDALAEYRALRAHVQDLWDSMNALARRLFAVSHIPCMWKQSGRAGMRWPGLHFVEKLEELRTLYAQLVPLIHRLNIAASACGKPGVELSDDFLDAKSCDVADL